LRANAWFTRFNLAIACFGDQRRFALKTVFEQASLYCEKLLLKNQAITRRLRWHPRLRVLPAAVITLTRKYRESGILRLQGAFSLNAIQYPLGVAARVTSHLPAPYSAG
jgi:hypothetical protein